MKKQIMSGSGAPCDLSIEPDENEVKCGDCGSVRNKHLKECPICAN